MTSVIHPKCGQSWTGLRTEHCPACCESFNSGTAGEKHRVGDWTEENPRRCLTPEEMRGLGMLVNDRGLWISEAYSDRRGGDSSPSRPAQGSGEGVNP